MNLTWKTYDDWKLAGYQVKRGEKGSPSEREDGKKLFSNKQVKLRETRRWGRMDDVGDYDEDMMTDDYIIWDIGDRY